jgi:integrase
VRGRHPSEILIADILAIYLTDVAPRHAREDETKQRVLTLDAWWAERTLAEVNGASCRAYVEQRTRQTWKSARPDKTGVPPRMVTAAAARRELEDLRAAINHHRREGLCSEIVSVVLPPRAEARERWLTRDEAARLLWAAWRARQVMRDQATLRAVGRHLARFILVGLYTGTRSAAICGAAMVPTVGRGHVDLEEGVFYRRAIGRRQTKKRQPPVKLPPRLLAHMRRWAAKGLSRKSVVEWNGKPVESVRKGFAAAAQTARLGNDVTPHILRHTCATWLMQGGANLWDAAGFLGMTVQQLEAGYGHHHPDFQQEAVAALGGQQGARNPVNKTRQNDTNVTKIIDLAKGR